MLTQQKFRTKFAIHPDFPCTSGTPHPPLLILFEFLNLGQWKVLLFVRFQLHVAAEVNVIKYKMLKAEITKLFVNDLSCDTL